jgi:hypothetical protein
VVDDLRLLQQQRDEALLASGEGLLPRGTGLPWDLLCLFRRRRIALLARGRVASSQIKVGTGQASRTDTSIEEAIAAAALGCFRSISADLLLFVSTGTK